MNKGEEDQARILLTTGEEDVRLGEEESRVELTTVSSTFHSFEDMFSKTKTHHLVLSSLKGNIMTVCFHSPEPGSETLYNRNPYILKVQKTYKKPACPL